jgi:hypothetical protein
MSSLDALEMAKARAEANIAAIQQRLTQFHFGATLSADELFYGRLLFDYWEKEELTLGREIYALELERDLAECRAARKGIAAAEEKLARVKADIALWRTQEPKKKAKIKQLEQELSRKNHDKRPQIRWQGSAIEFAKWVEEAWKEKRFGDIRKMAAFEQLRPHFVQKNGKPFKARSLWQGLQNKKDSETP